MTDDPTHHDDPADGAKSAEKGAPTVEVGGQFSVTQLPTVTPPGRVDPGEVGPLVEAGAQVDHFRVLRRLGKGGMGEVFLARDTRLGRRVALKVLHPGVMGSDDAVARFLREAQMTARFSHPHIITVFAVGEYRGSPYLALEYLEGQDLRERMQEERLSFPQAARTGLAIAEALAEAHRHQVLHRDLKPENVMLPLDGRLRVVDFGLARPATAVASMPDAAPDAPTRSLDLPGDLSMDGKIRGTPAYTAPEIWLEGQAVEASDVWALGLILYEMLTGRYPWKGSNIQQIAARVLYAEIPPLGDDVPPALAALVHLCLERDPAERATAQVVVDALAELLGTGAPLRAGQRPPFRGLLPWDERDADRFYGRDREIDAFLERLRHDAVLPVVGASGAGKSSFVRAGVIPRLHEQGRWTVLRLRPGRDPLRALAARLLAGGPSRTTYRTFHTERSQGGSASLDPDAASSSSAEIAAQEEVERALAAELRESPSRLALRMLRIADEQQGRVLLYIDQLEELYTLCDDPDAAAGFLEAICTAAGDPEEPVRVVFTLRDDFLVRVAGSPAARDALGRVTVLRSPEPEALGEILDKPVAAAGYRFEDAALPGEMVSEVQGERVPLPLLQVAGAFLWERRDKERRLLTRAAYNEMGGVAGALARHADEVLEGLQPGHTRLARALLLRLVTPDGTRRVMARERLLEGLDAEARDVLWRLVEGRLVLIRKARATADGEGTSPRRTPAAELELIHESLIHSWDRLGRWIEEDREELSFVAEVGQAAELWRKRGARDEEVWEGDALHDAARRAERVGHVPAEIRAFLDAGLHKQRGAALRRRNRVIGAFAALAVLATMLGVLALYATGQRAEADAGRELAEQKQAEALRGAAAQALALGDPFDARLKIRAALEAEDSALARAIWWQLTRSPLQWSRRMPGRSVQKMAISSDGRYVAAGGWAACVFDRRTASARVLRGNTSFIHAVEFFPDDRRVIFGNRIWDLEQDHSIDLPAHGPDWQITRMSPDGTVISTTANDDLLKLWDPASQELVASFEPVVSRDFCDGGGRIAVLFEDDTIQLFDLGHWDEPQLLHDGSAPIQDLDRVRCAPQGSWLSASSLRGERLWLWDLSTGQRRTLEVPGIQINAYFFAQDGSLVALGGVDGSVVFWPLPEGEPRILHGHSGPVLGLWVADDGSRVATLGRDWVAHVWDVETGQDLLEVDSQELSMSSDGRWLATVDDGGDVSLWDLDVPVATRPLQGHQGLIYSVHASPDGRLVASGGDDDLIIVWDAETGRPLHVSADQGSDISAVRFSPDGRLLATGDRNGAIRLWDSETGATLRVLDVGTAAWTYDLSFHPDGTILASSGREPFVQLWDPASGELIERLATTGTAHTKGVRFSRDGRWLVATDRSGFVWIWDRDTGSPPRQLQGHERWIWGLDLSPDSRWIATASIDHTVRVWDLLSGEEHARVELPGRAYSVVFSPDSQTVAAACSDGLVHRLTLDGQQLAPLRGHRGEVNWVSTLPDGTLISVGDDTTVRAWDGISGQPRWRAPALLGSPPELCTHSGWQRLDGSAPDGTTVAWRDAIRTRGLDAARAGADGWICLGTMDQTVELWDPAEDRLRATAGVPGLVAVEAVAGGCLTLDGDGVIHLHAPDGGSRRVQGGATAMAPAPDGFLTATAHQLVIHDAAGERLRGLPTAGTVTAAAHAGTSIVVGYEEGDLELLPADGEGARTELVLRDTPYAPVTSLLLEPEGLVIAGYADGTLGIWSRENGAELHRLQLHGPVRHLLIEDEILYAATALGDHDLVDLAVFYRERCALLRDVWDQVPVQWDGGQAVEQSPPPEHLCAQ